MMIRRQIFLFLSVFLITTGCGDKETDSDTNIDTGSDTGPDTAEDTDTFPDDPSPFQIQLSGDESENLRFDEPYCNNMMGSSNLRIFWRDSTNQHVWVLVAELMGSFDGAGTYTLDENGSVRVKLQEEAGGQARGYMTSHSDGDTAQIVLEHVEENRLYGHVTVSSMHGTNGQIGFSPVEFPIWCPSIDQ